jgi:ribosomal protein S18 acetylase RimI-like enzyme
MQEATDDEKRQAHASLSEGPRMTEAPLRRAEAGDVPVLVRVLARAFDSDPFINWLVRQDERRSTRIEWAFEVMLRRMSSELNETHTSSELGGAAVWRRPGELKLSFGQQLALLPAFAQGMGWGRVPRFLRMLQHMEGLHDRLVPEPHFYLFVLGVEPEQQGRGLGTRLLAPVLARCDAEGRRAYLETARADNIPFYVRQGFEVADVVARPAWPKLWLMRREPGAAPPRL